jgi:hypothetical protein
MVLPDLVYIRIKYMNLVSDVILLLAVFKNENY